MAIVLYRVVLTDDIYQRWALDWTWSGSGR